MAEHPLLGSGRLLAEKKDESVASRSPLIYTPKGGSVDLSTYGAEFASEGIDLLVVSESTAITENTFNTVKEKINLKKQSGTNIAN